MNRGVLLTRRAVKADCDKRGVSQNDIARELEFDPGAFSKVLAAKRDCGRSLSLRIKKKYGVPLESWDEPLPAEAP
jgi:plasmid maintenance system antidote protein VapI